MNHQKIGSLNQMKILPLSIYTRIVPLSTLLMILQTIPRRVEAENYLLILVLNELERYVENVKEVLRLAVVALLAQILRRHRQKMTEDRDSNDLKRLILMISTSGHYQKTWPNMRNSYLNEFVQDADIKEAILQQNPVPSNISKPRKLDDFLKELLEEGNKNHVLRVDHALEKIQQKTINIFGPLSRVWYTIDQARKSKENKVEVSMRDLTKSVEQAVTMIGQSFNAVSYQRRLNVLSTVMKEGKKAKQTLKEKADLLQKEDVDLFGDRFRTHISKTVKSKEKSKELFKNISSPMRQKKPFRSGPPQQRSGGGQSFYLSKDNNKYNGNSNPYNGGFQGKFDHSRIRSKLRPSGSHSTRKIKVHSSTDKKIILRNSPKRSISRKTKTFPKELGESNFRSKHSIGGFGLRHSVHKPTVSKQTASLTQTFDRTSGIGKCGGRRNVEEGSNSKSLSYPRSVSQQYLSCWKEGWGKETRDKSQELKCLYSIPTLQNGGHPFIEGSVEGERFHVQIGHEGCLLLRSVKQEFQKIYSISLGRELVRVLMPLFRFRTSPFNFHQANENSHSFTEKDQYTGNCLFRRYAINEPDTRAYTHEPRHSYFSSSTSGVCGKPEKVGSRTSQNHRVFGSVYKLSGYDNIPPTGENCKNNIQVQRFDQVTPGVDFRVNSVDRSTIINCSSSVACSTSISIPATTTNSCITHKAKLSSDYYSEPRIFTGTTVVESKSANLQWEVFNSSETQPISSDRRVKTGLGCSLPRNFYRRDLVFSGAKTSYKCFRTDSSKTSNSYIYQKQPGNINPPAGGQYNGFSLPNENGGYPKQGNDHVVKRNLGSPPRQQDHDYCRVLTKRTECDSGLGIPTCSGFLRMETKSKDIPVDMSTIRHSEYGFICVSTFSSSTSLHGLETRPIVQSSRCNATTVGSSLPLCIPSIFTHREGSRKSIEGTGTNVNNNTGLADSTMVHQSSRNVSKKPSIITSLLGSVERPKRKHASVSPKQLLETSGMDGLRKKMATEGLSKRAADLITSSRRPGTISNYESSWRKWSSWCTGREVDPFQCPLRNILDYLAELFELGLSYRTINSHRSAISAYHVQIDGISVGKHPQVCALITGVFNNNPPQPRYTFIWDVDVVLFYMKALPNNTALSDKLLTMKLTMLLALTAASRGSELKLLDIRYMAKTDSCYTFTFTGLFKSWKQGNAPPSIDFHAFSQDQHLCIVNTIDDYLTRSQPWRTLGQSQLLLSFVNPHKAVVKSTISGWLKFVLKEAGVNTDTFKAHSVRSASSSKASFSGLSVKDILSRGNWSNKSTWQKFYHKQIISPAARYQAKVVQTHSSMTTTKL